MTDSNGCLTSQCWEGTGRNLWNHEPGRHRLAYFQVGGRNMNGRHGERMAEDGTEASGCKKWIPVLAAAHPERPRSKTGVGLGAQG